MKLLISQTDLLPILSSVSRSCGVKNTLPVLGNILLSTSNGRLKLSATNLEIGVVKEIKANVEIDGEITVPARTLLEVVSSLTSEQITLELIADQMKITTSKFSASLNTIPASEFPTIPTSFESSIIVEPQVLSNSLPQISFAAAVDEGRPILTGILTEIKKGSLEMVATDGFRLAHQKVELKDGESFKALIPRKTLEEMVRLISEEEEISQVEISTTENKSQIIFKVGTTLVSSRLIEGQFPAWEKVIPTNFVNRVVIDRVAFLKSVKLASVFAKDAASLIRLKTTAKSLELSSATKEVGEQQSEVEAASEGEDVSIAFNSKYLTDALSACSTSQVTIEFSGNLGPALIKPMGDSTVEYVIMPVRES